MKNYLSIAADNFVSLTQAFKNNGWVIPVENEGVESRFTRFCERLSIFEYEEQKLIIELTKRFTTINSTEYLSVIIKLLNENIYIHDRSFEELNKLFIFPLIAPDDFSKTKSSKFVWYLLHDENIKYNKVFLNKKLVLCEIDKIDWVKKLKDKEKIILVDDYIGSGETAESAVKWFVDKHQIALQNIVILTLAAQNEGLQHLKSLGIEVYTYYHLDKGISDYYTGDELDDYTKLMEKIEVKLKIEDKYKFGYNNSEALVALTRAPNNTFPVFWKSSGRHKIVPFPRD